MEDGNNMSKLPPEVASLLAMAMTPMEDIDRPFGMTWYDENIEKFLVDCGYILINREHECSGESYKVAVKKEDLAMPIDESNIYETFLGEMQNKIIELLRKI